jgi:hypothetical protein
MGNIAIRCARIVEIFDDHVAEVPSVSLHVAPDHLGHLPPLTCRPRLNVSLTGDLSRSSLETLMSV